MTYEEARKKHRTHMRRLHITQLYLVVLLITRAYLQRLFPLTTYG